MPTPRAKHIYYFCDESSYRTDEFMAIGGLAVPDYNLNKTSDALNEIKAKMGITHEVKWSNVKSRRDNVHKAFIDYVDKGIKEGEFHFHIRFAPFRLYDHTKSGPRKRIDTTSKMYFQLLLHRAARFYGKNYKIRIRPDNGDCTQERKNHLSALEYYASFEYGCAEPFIEDIESRDSSKEVILQLLDVPLGALTALRNKRTLIGPKLELAQYVAKKFSHKDLHKSCGKKVMDFSIWNASPKGAPKRDPWG